MESLNQDVLIEILSHLPVKDKVHSSIVCKSWSNSNKYIYKNQPIKIDFYKIQNPKFVKWVENKNVKLSLDIRILDEFTRVGIQPILYPKIVELINVFSQYSIMEIPDYIFEFENLIKLGINWNRIEIVSDKISKLQHLETLFLSFNNLTILPDSFGQLKKFKTIVFTRKQI